MFPTKYNIVLAFFGLVWSLVYLTEASSDCDPTTCTGPLFYYRELGCIPIFDNSSSCCATKYNCDHWKNLPDSKCFLNGRVYESGELFPDREIGGGCTRCICGGGTTRPACLSSSCAGPRPGCYLQLKPLECCSTVEICPEKEEDIPTCEVDGKTYKDGERFSPLAEPDKTCTCSAGYTGDNNESFCVTKGPGWCGNAIWSLEKILNNCAPIYPFGVEPRKNCNVDYRCQMADHDSIVENDTDAVSGSEEPDMMCKFGNLTMKVGQMLNQPADESQLMRCVCEVPPVVTCQYMGKYLID